MRSTTPAIPHRNLIKLLLLAGIPILSDKTGITCITDILYEYEFNLHGYEYYKEIEDSLKANPAEALMIDKNESIYRANVLIKDYPQRKDLYIDDNAMAKYYMPPSAVDLMYKFHGSPRRQRKQTNGITRIMHTPNYRRMIEVMLTRGVPFAKIASYLNDKPNPEFRLNQQDISLYHYYIWKWCPLEESMGQPLSELYNYLFLNPDSEFYRVHRTLLNDMDLDEILVHMTAYGENERNHINKKMFGLSSTEILRNMRAGKRISMISFQVYAHSDTSIATDKQNKDIKDITERIDEMFASVSFVGQKRLTMSEIQAGYTPGSEPESDEPAQISRLIDQTK